MWDHGLTLEASQLLVRKARPLVYPNPGFQRQLQIYEKRLSDLRYAQNQQARYNEDYVTIDKKYNQKH
jgi:hypothetical protein